MKAMRPLVTALVGLLLLVQGVAVAASPVLVKAATAASGVANAPCHWSATDKIAKSCCGSDCTDMSACAFGHIAGSPAAGFVSIVPATQRFAAVRASVLVRPPQFLLRPPIALHA